MKNNMILSQKLKEAGAPDDIILQYQRYMDSGNKQGQERLLGRFRKMQNDILKKDREKLARLDYIIAKVENTKELFKYD